MKEEKEFCPYCGSKKIIMCNHALTSILEAPVICGGLQYKCEDCGKVFAQNIVQNVTQNYQS